MPYKKRKKSDGTYKCLLLRVTRAKSTTKKKAEAQIRLLNAVEHGWEPTKVRRRKRF